jgi:hypothetical protein
VSPNLRRAAHQALDIVLDALAEEGRAAQPVAKKRRGQVAAELPVPARELTADERAQLDRQLRRAGYKKSA